MEKPVAFVLQYGVALQEYEKSDIQKDWKEKMSGTQFGDVPLIIVDRGGVLNQISGTAQ